MRGRWVPMKFAPLPKRGPHLRPFDKDVRQAVLAKILNKERSRWKFPLQIQYWGALVI